jgi:hypothetical protein
VPADEALHGLEVRGAEMVGDAVVEARERRVELHETITFSSLARIADDRSRFGPAAGLLRGTSRAVRDPSCSRSAAAPAACAQRRSAGVETGLVVGARAR